MRSKANQRNHQFDLLRILFATLVLLAHAPELTDGNRSRELLTRLTHSSVSFGSAGVDGFFLLSGFLIVKSWHGNPDLLDFMSKRFLRIAPGYAAATVLTTIAAGILAPGVSNFFRHIDINSVKSIFFIFRPKSPPVFAGNPHPELNGALWTILYEFRCYVFVAVFGICGFFRRPLLWLAVTLPLMVFLAIPTLADHLPWPGIVYSVLGDPVKIFRLTAVFFVGGCFFLFRQRIQFLPMLALCAAAIIVLVRFIHPAFMETALVIFGGYLIFYFTSLPIKAFGDTYKLPDISYGVYLYGWPVESLLIWYYHSSPWVTFVAATVICFGLGWASWHLVEKPMLALKRKRSSLPSLTQIEEPVPS